MATTMRTPLNLSKLCDRAALLQPDEKIITKIEGGYHTITYREHQGRVFRLASALAKWGVRVGDRVATLCWNTARHYQCYHAVPCMGAVLHTLNLRLGPVDLGYILHHAGARVLVVDADQLPAVEALAEADLAHVELIVVCGTDERPGGWSSPLRRTVDWDAFLATGEPTFAWPELDEDAPMGLCYTSGTTGRPKGVAYSHRGTYLHTLTAALPDSLGIRGTDVVLPVVNMYHALAWGIPYITLMLGCRFCNLNRFLAPGPTLEFFRDHGVTMSNGVPTIWQGIRGILNANPELGRGLALKWLTVGGSAPPPEMMRWYYEKYGIQFIQAWGMTETGPLATLAKMVVRKADLALDADGQFANVVKAGILVPGLEMKIVDPDDYDRELARDGQAQGELLIRGPFITGAYYKNPDAQKKFHNGWLTTGDIASIEPGGDLLILDRSKDVIKSGGEWISSVDLENHIQSHSSVAMSAVVAQPHPKWDERPVAVVVCNTGCSVTKAEVIEWCKSKFARFQLPDDVLFWSEIPMGSTGKMSKKAIRDKLQQDGYVLPTLAKL